MGKSIKRPQIQKNLSTKEKVANNKNTRERKLKRPN